MVKLADFGNPHFASDFLYQTEWQQFAKEGFLHKYDFAWSRDQEKKIYVQDKIRENSTALWQWLQEGAYFMCVVMQQNGKRCGASITRSHC